MQIGEKNKWPLPAILQVAKSAAAFSILAADFPSVHSEK
jgi:hypothetical protein